MDLDWTRGVLVVLLLLPLLLLLQMLSEKRPATHFASITFPTSRWGG